MNNLARDISHVSSYTVRVLHPNDVEDGLLLAWADLEARAVVPNAFLSPYFVMPAIRYLESTSDVLMVFVEKAASGMKDLVGVGIFQVRRPTRQFPLMHLSTFTSIHSYLSGFLLDREHAGEALRMIYGYLTDGGCPWHGLYIDNCPAEHLLPDEMKEAARDVGLKWTTFSSWERAVFHAADFDGEIEAYLGKNQRKNYHRCVRNLKDQGMFEWRLVRGTEPLERNVDEFIRLENMGWKGREETSLYSNADHVSFFKEMISGFNRVDRAYFTELSINGHVISSTSNLISGRAGFGFKVGWDPEFSKYSPGVVNEIQTIEHVGEKLGDLDYIDSSASPDSYISKIWTGRRAIVEGMFTFTPKGQAALAGVQIVKKIKNLLFITLFQVWLEIPVVLVV
ncbi:MAG: GNAT family N-acetyltransferase [Anaerolineales bacterium]|nr:MAG: GNAT family N-acetyltransferase [Anaerolineales bacterium]